MNQTEQHYKIRIVVGAKVQDFEEKLNKALAEISVDCVAGIDYMFDDKYGFMALIRVLS